MDGKSMTLCSKYQKLLCYHLFHLTLQYKNLTIYFISVHYSHSTVLWASLFMRQQNPFCPHVWFCLKIFIYVHMICLGKILSLMIHLMELINLCAFYFLLLVFLLLVRLWKMTLFFSLKSFFLCFLLNNNKQKLFFS